MKELFEKYFPTAEEVSFGRKEVITREGQRELYLYWVIEGIQRSYYIKDGKEFTIAFTYNPSFSGIPESAISGKPSRYFLEAITPSTMMRISHEEVEKRAAADHEFEQLYRRLTQQLLVGVLERQFELLALSSAERFEVFMDRSAHLINEIPHKHIASYLGIDATNFSKLLNSRDW